MGLFNLIGSLQNLESAEAAGDRYPAAPCLAVNGIGTLTAAIFGSCFPTTIYIGHPGLESDGSKGWLFLAQWFSHGCALSDGNFITTGLLYPH